MKEEPPNQLRVQARMRAPLGTKPIVREYAQCERSAARRGQTLSEWQPCLMRPSDAQALLAAVESPAQGPEDEAILSEILALRKIVINLSYGQTAGEPLDEERMRELIEAADSGVAPQSSGTPAGRTNSTSWSLER